MMAGTGSDVVVLGVGNPLLSDDGAGIAALDLLQRRSAELPPSVRLIDAGTVGPDLLGDVAGCRALIVLDAVDVGRPAGEVVRLDLADGFDRSGLRTVHDLGLVGLLGDLRLLGEFPERAVLLGIQPASIEVGTMLSPPVVRGLGTLVSAAVHEVGRMRGRVARRWKSGQRAL